MQQWNPRIHEAWQQPDLRKSTPSGKSTESAQQPQFRENVAEKGIQLETGQIQERKKVSQTLPRKKEL